MKEEAVEIDGCGVTLAELALEWAACRRALQNVSDLTGDELDRFARCATLLLLGFEDAA